jgi:hypothetical protein
VFEKEVGKKPWENCCINWILKKSHRLLKGRISAALKSGSV